MIVSHAISEHKYLNPSNADASLEQFLDGVWEKQRDCKPHGTVQRHCYKHSAGWDGVSQKDEEGKGDKNNYLAGRKERGHVEASQVGALHDFGDLLAKTTREERQIDRGIKGSSPKQHFFYFTLL